MPLFLCYALLPVPTSTSHLLSDTASVEQAALGSGTAGFIDRLSSTILPCFPMRKAFCVALLVTGMTFLLWFLKHSPTLVDSVAQDSDTFNEIGAAFQVKGDLKNALSSACRLRDSLYIKSWS